MSRRWIALGLLAGVIAAGDASASPGARSAPTAKPKRAALARANGSNMPRGFTWPPSRAMATAEAACTRALDAGRVAWKPARREGRIAAAVTIDDGMLGGIAYTPVFGKGPYKLDCQLAKALHA